MAEPRVTDIRGLDLAVRDLAASVDFYARVWGLEEASRDANTVYLRATGQEHHVLALHQGTKIEVLAASYAVPDKTTVDALHAKAVAAGADVLDAPHALSGVAGGGYGFGVAFELPDLDGLMGASGRLKMNGYPIEWGVGRHAGPGHNVYSFFVDPNGIATEYTTDMDQVDDATYQYRSAEEWRNVPVQPCMWGMGIERSEKLLLARTGKLIEELNRSCTDAISQKLAS